MGAFTPRSAIAPSEGFRSDSLSQRPPNPSLGEATGRRLFGGAGTGAARHSARAAPGMFSRSDADYGVGAGTVRPRISELPNVAREGARTFGAHIETPLWTGTRDARR